MFIISLDHVFYNGSLIKAEIVFSMLRIRNLRSLEFHYLAQSHRARRMELWAYILMSWSLVLILQLDSYSFNLRVFFWKATARGGLAFVASQGRDMLETLGYLFIAQIPGHNPNLLNLNLRGLGGRKRIRQSRNLLFNIPMSRMIPMHTKVWEPFT